MIFFSYQHTNCFAIANKMDGRLLAIDAGWPCSLRKYQRKLKEAGYKFDNISWVRYPFSYGPRGSPWRIPSPRNYMFYL